MKAGLVFACGLTLLALSGCSYLGIDNRSLEYKQVKDIAPLQYPSTIQPRPPSPLYPAPKIDPASLQHAPQFENKRGNRFALPRPENNLANVNTLNDDDTSSHVARPLLLKNVEDQPVLRIEGPSAAIWQYTQATLSVLNIPVTAKGKDGYESSIKVNDESYILRLNFFAGRAYDLQVFQLDNQPASADKAQDILTKIYQNWPDQ